MTDVDLWIMALLFLLGLVLTWFAMVRTVSREVGPATATRTTGRAEEVATYRADSGTVRTDGTPVSTPNTEKTRRPKR